MADRGATFGDDLKSWRTSQGLTQEQAAAMFGKSQSWYNKHENGKVNPTPETRRAFDTIKHSQRNGTRSRGSNQECIRLLGEIKAYAKEDPERTAIVLQMAVQMFKLGKLR